MLGQLLTIILHFVIRTVFIHTLGKSYLGISSLFSNILTMISLADLGVGTAILYKLYEPIAKCDTKRIKALMYFYKWAYRIIGIIAALLGLCFIPFFPIMINDYQKFQALGINAIAIFLLYLLQSVSSYLFFAYKSAIIKANQREYIVNLVGFFTTIVSGIIQIIFLYLFENFFVYVAISVLSVIIQNMCCAIIANRMFPYIKGSSEDRIGKDEIKGIFKDCGALFLYRMNSVVMKSTDNIVLAAFLGMDIVAIYSNYYIFYTTIKTLVNKVFDAVAHGLGNLHALDTSKHEFEVFETIMLIATIIGATTSVGIFVCADEVIKIWLGFDWVIKQPFSLLFGLEMYTLAVRAALSKYRSSMGLFRQSAMRPVLGMIINVLISVGTVKSLGICGVLLGTIAADWLTFMWLDPLIIYKYGFNNKYSIKGYYFRFIKNFLITCVIAVVDYTICSHLVMNNALVSCFCHIAICGISSPIIIIVLSLNSAPGRHLVKIIKNLKK